LVIRDRVELTSPAKLCWLLHAEKNLSWDEKSQSAIIRGNKATLKALIVSPGMQWHGSVTDQFPVAIDPKYTTGEVGSSYVTGKWTNQSHLTLESVQSAQSFSIFAILWPERGAMEKQAIFATRRGSEVLISRPDQKQDRLTITDDALVLN
jgi:hypothetical protein